MKGKTIKDKEQTFWVDYLDGMTFTSVIGTEKEDKEEKFHCIEYVFDEITTKEINYFLKNNSFKLDELMYTSWAILLNHYTYNNDILFGMNLPIDTDSHDGKENILPLRINIDQDISLNEMLSSVKKSLYLVKEFSNNNLKDIPINERI